jgi:hypothetical protein
MGHFLTRSSERKQWRRDRKQEEFRELVTSLVAGIMEQQKVVSSSEPGEPASKMFTAQYTALQTIADRIFVRADIEPLKVSAAYISANEDFSKDRNFEKFGGRMDELINAIVKVAEKL